LGYIHGRVTPEIVVAILQRSSTGSPSCVSVSVLVGSMDADGSACSSESVDFSLLDTPDRTLFPCLLNSG